MIQFFRRQWNSVSFRLTLNYGLLAILTTAILIAFIYVQFLGALRTEYTRQITSAAQRLIANYEDRGREGLVWSIELTLSDRIDSGREIYLLLDEKKQTLAGNFEIAADFTVPHTGIFDAQVIRDGASVHGHLQVHELTGGETLIVGQDSSEIDDFTSLIGQATLAAISLAILLVLVGTYIFKKELAYRVSHIRRTTQQISAGQLSKRIPAPRGEDEFTLLNRDINTMLDRIEVLMKSARHISDTIAHNIRTPLTRITGALRAAQQPGLSMAQVLESNQQAIEGTERLNVLLDKLLQIAEMEAGIQRRSFKPCDLDVIVTDVMEMYDTLAEEKGISLARCNRERIVLHGDVNLLASALANLLDNAVKYGKSKVLIDVAIHGNAGRITIEDDGPGLAASEYEHLGKHFYRTDPSKEGHGLGLTSVKSIVSLHHGKLQFSNAYPGLRVVMLLPLDVKGN